MKKKILFIEEGLGVGGAEKSLLTLLSMLDYEKYDVDLFLFKHSGTFMHLIPKEVNLLTEDVAFKQFNKNRKLAPFIFLKQGDFKKSYFSSVYLIKALVYNFIFKRNYMGWNEIKHIFSSLVGRYDIAISYLEGKCFYYSVDKVNTKKRIGFVHIDYRNIDYDYELDFEYMKDFESIATVSENCKRVLIDIFPEYRDKFVVIKNMINEKDIIRMAQEPIEFDKNSEYTYITTVGRLTYQKGIDDAILICKELVNRGFNIKWYVVGKGEDFNHLSLKIKEYQLQNNFFLLGAKTNPYKYMNLCDIYVQPSRFEGYGITVAEAKCLGKPIVATNIPEFEEQLIHGETGLLYSNTTKGIELIVSLIENKSLRKTMAENLQKTNFKSYKKEIYKLYDIID